MSVELLTQYKDLLHLLAEQVESKEDFSSTQKSIARLYPLVSHCTGVRIPAVYVGHVRFTHYNGHQQTYVTDPVLELHDVHHPNRSVRKVNTLRNRLIRKLTTRDKQHMKVFDKVKQ